MSKDNIEVQLNSKEGVLWRNTAKGIEEKIAVDRIQSELDKVALEHCKKKAEEDSQKIKEDLETKK